MSKAADDRELLYGEVTDAILADLHAGRRPDMAALARRYPELAGELDAHAAQLTAVLHCALAPTSEWDARATPAPRRVGDFRLLREVGRGGMGIVYEAEQVSLQRRVALKVLPSATLLDPLRLQRFRHEAQAAARLQHPHVVPVFAVGCEDGLHYYAMQFVDGQCAAAFIQDLRRQAGRATAAAAQAPAGVDTPVPETTERDVPGPAHFRNVAKWGRQAAEALHYAHEVGIVHRDVKPANLLLDVHGDLWVTDFGLARLRGEAELTATGDVVGTLRYMSPEQALGVKGVADHRVDVYGLGATLYELLTLEPVLPGQDRQEMMHRLLNDEPRPPRTLDAAIPFDLETIVLKALRQDPAERYASAAELAADLRRFLEGQPIHAQRPTWRERARAWAGRHAVGIAVTGGVLLLFSTILAISVAMTVRAYHEVAHREAEAQQARQEAAEKQKAAERSRALARQAIDQVLSRVVVDWHENEAALDPAQRRLVEQLLACAQQLAGEDRADAAAQMRVALAWAHSAAFQGWLDQHEAALTSNKEALAILDDLERQQGNGHVYANLRSRCLINQGVSYLNIDEPARAEQAFQQVIALLEPLCARPTAEPLQRYRLIMARDNFACLLQEDPRRAGQAEAIHRRAIGELQRLIEAEPLESYRHRLAKAHINLTRCLSRANRTKEAEESIREALALFRQLRDDRPAARTYRDGLALSLARHAQILARSGRAADAKSLAEEAVKLADELAREFGSIPSYRERCAGHRLVLTEALGAAGQFREAQKPAEAAVAMFQELVTALPKVRAVRQSLVEANLLLGRCRLFGRSGDAEPPLREGVRLLLPLLEEAPERPALRQHLVTTLPQLRERQAAGERYPAAVDFQQQIATVLERLIKQRPDDWVWQDELANTRGFLGVLYLRLGQRQQALASFQHQHDALVALVKPSVADRPGAAANLAWFLANCPAVECRQPAEAVRLAEQVQRTPDGASRGCQIVLGAAYNRVGRFDDALRVLEKLEPAVIKVAGAVDLWAHLAIARHGRGHHDEAIETLRRAVPWVQPGQPVHLDRRLLLEEVSRLLDDPDLSRQLALPAVEGITSKKN